MIILLVLGTFLLSLFDAVIIASFVVNIVKIIFGETPLSRLLRLVGGISSCGLYGYWAIYKTAEFWASTDDINPIGMIIPLVLPLLLIAVIYIIRGSGTNDSNG